jgi:tRNA(fMet)-specific endonuclease VapC
VRYLLDTNICIYIAKERPAPVLARLEQTRPGDLGMSIVTYLELMYGAWKSQHREQSMLGLERLKKLIPVAPLEESAAKEYGRIRTDLERKGTPIGPHDLLIAAHALCLHLTLVTNNVREFSRIGGLKVENWAA